jgi:ABC-type Fe3+-siderophore transport system permease subunit
VITSMLIIAGAVLIVGIMIGVSSPTGKIRGVLSNARKRRSIADEFEERRRQRIITARLVVMALALAVVLAIELKQRSGLQTRQMGERVSLPSDNSLSHPKGLLD